MKVPLAGGTPVILFPAPAVCCADTPVIAVDATTIYWTNYVKEDTRNGFVDYGAVMQAPLAGGPATALVSLGSNLKTLHGLAIDGASVYYTDRGQVLRIDKHPCQNGLCK